MKYAHIWKQGKQFGFLITPTCEPRNAVASGVATSKKEARIAIDDYAKRNCETVKAWNY